nr:MAG TPA: hypothetical protein [Caudoviricetes sp.]
MERENKVTVLCFGGLPKMDGSTAYLHIDLEKNSDVIEIVDGQADVTRTITQFTGGVEAFVEVLGANDRVWHSQIMELFVGRLPVLGEKIEQEYPTAFEQALAQTAADKAAAAKSAADAAATAAGIVTEETERKDAERKRVKAESARETAEANREQAEAAREKEVADALTNVADAENAVQANEQQRVLAERTRVAQEQARQSAEQSRVEAEQARKQAEQRRETAETSRTEAERQRESMETSRQTAETTRNAAENGRAKAEKARETAESQRQQAETARADAEGKRVQAEQGRVTAEQGRVEAEAQREEAMAQHAEKIAELESEVAKKAQIDDTTVSGTEAWSSQHIVDMLCPPLEASGNPVVCYPVAGSKLEVTASWEPTQEGEGTPSPDNIRPIHGRNSVSITRQEDELSMTLALLSTIYGGEAGVGGEGQTTWKILTLDGTEAWGKYGSTAEAAGASCFSLDIDDKDIGFGTSVCNQFINTKNSNPFYNVNMKKFTYTDHPSIKTIYMNYGDDQTVTVDTWKAYLAAQYAAGTPVQIAYKLATPVPFTATGGGTIKALSGTNTILTDADALTVKGRADPIRIIQQLQAASAASAQALADVERAVTDI